MLWDGYYAIFRHAIAVDMLGMFIKIVDIDPNGQISAAQRAQTAGKTLQTSTQLFPALKGGVEVV